MNILSVYQTVYTVLFVLAGVFFAMSIVFFFLFKIQNVYENLYGTRIGKKRSGNTASVRPVRKKRGKRTEKNAFDEPVKTIKQTNGKVSINGTATVMTRFLEIVMIEPEEVVASESSTEPLGNSSRSSVIMSESAKQRLSFKPDVKILEFSAGDRI